MPSKTKVVVGMSGGVDSSVAASLLIEEGYEVVGAFMKNWSDTKDPLTGECAWRAEQADAMRVAADLGIPFVAFDFEEAYRKEVVEYLYREYAAGRTPNPDVMCNRAVKFDLFLKEALKMGASHIATGHYARVRQTADGYQLLAGLDRNKDQSYFVFSLGQEQLAHVLFPIGHLDKRDVRAYAQDRKLHVAAKKDSQGICFIGKVELGAFLKKAMSPKPGEIVTVEGEVVGHHPDVQAFTIGQRHGLGIGGGAPYFVVRTEIETARVIVARGADHPALYRSTLQAQEWHWVSGAEPALPLRCSARIRYRQPLQRCEVVPSAAGPGTLEVRFEKPQRAVTPGQFIVLYDGDTVLGGAAITQLPSV